MIGEKSAWYPLYPRAPGNEAIGYKDLLWRPSLLNRQSITMIGATGLLFVLNTTQTVEMKREIRIDGKITTHKLLPFTNIFSHLFTA